MVQNERAGRMNRQNKLTTRKREPKERTGEKYSRTTSGQSPRTHFWPKTSLANSPTLIQTDNQTDLQLPLVNSTYIWLDWLCLLPFHLPVPDCTCLPELSQKAGEMLTPLQGNSPDPGPRGERPLCSSEKLCFLLALCPQGANANIIKLTFSLFTFLMAHLVSVSLSVASMTIPKLPCPNTLPKV